MDAFAKAIFTVGVFLVLIGVGVLIYLIQERGRNQ